MSQHTELIASLRAESDELIKYQFSHTKEAMSCLQRLHDLSLEAADALQALEPDDSGIVPDSDKVICPGCSHQFTAIPGNVQARLQALERVPGLGRAGLDRNTTRWVWYVAARGGGQPVRRATPAPRPRTSPVPAGSAG